MLIFTLFKLLISLTITLLLPGYCLFWFLQKKSALVVSRLESLVLSVGLSIFVIDFVFILLDLVGIKINRLSSLFFILLVSVIFLLLGHRAKKSKIGNIVTSKGNFSQSYYWAIAAIFFLTIIIRTIYVAQGAIPQTTDLGHHMYWAKTIVTTGQLPDYGMPDFIIGEHIIFGVIGVISGIDFVSAMPVATLFVINIISLLALFLLAFRASQMVFNQKAAPLVAMLCFLTIGVFYCISSPQAKFVSQGVIGNVIGNFLVPLVFYAFLSGIYYHRHQLVSRMYFLLFILLSVTLAYTHHLSTFVFLFAFAGFVIGFILLYLLITRLQLKSLFNFFKENFQNLFCVRNFIVILAFVPLMLYFFPPSYLNESAIDTAVGTPIKETRTGIDLMTLTLTTGPWRFFYSAIALLILAIALIQMFFRYPKQSSEDSADLVQKIIGISLLSAWFGMIFIMSNQPTLLRVDIPSNRIASYLTIPSAILSAIGIFYLLKSTKDKLSLITFSLLFAALLGTGFISGLGDITDSARSDVNAKAVRQVFQASEYLARTTAQDEVVLKDHIYLTADSWIKLFLMRDYKNPLSRSILRRYDDIAKDRETCTRDMVAIPDSEVGQACFKEMNTQYVMLHPGNDTEQFENSGNFSKIYFSSDVVIYKINSL